MEEAIHLFPTFSADAESESRVNKWVLQYHSSLILCIAIRVGIVDTSLPHGDGCMIIIR